MNACGNNMSCLLSLYNVPGPVVSALYVPSYPAEISWSNMMIAPLQKMAFMSYCSLPMIHPQQNLNLAKSNPLLSPFPHSQQNVKRTHDCASWSRFKFMSTNLEWHKMYPGNPTSSPPKPPACSRKSF